MDRRRQRRRAFLYRDDRLEQWHADTCTIAFDVNEFGVVAGRGANDANHESLAYLHLDGVTTVLPDAPGGGRPILAAVNNVNQSAGTLGKAGERSCIATAT